MVGLLLLTSLSPTFIAALIVEFQEFDRTKPLIELLFGGDVNPYEVVSLSIFPLIVAFLIVRANSIKGLKVAEHTVRSFLTLVEQNSPERSIHSEATQGCKV